VTSFRSVVRVGAVSVALVAASVAVSPNAVASSKRTAGVAFLRGAHLSPDTASVDVYLTSFSGGTTTLWLSRVGYGDVSGYRRIAPGEYAVSMRPHGAAKTTKPALSWSIQLKAGRAYTALAIGHQAQLRGTIVEDSLSSPAAETGRIRVVQASSRAGRVDVATSGGKVLASDLSFGGISAYVAAPAGVWKVQVTSLSDPKYSGQTTVSLASKSVASIVVLDGKGSGVQVRALLDAAGAGGTPLGAVPAGGGGTAQRPASSSGTALTTEIGVAAAGLLLVVSLGTVRRRRRGQA
jgi:Domain of unknown function (DUF4397)